MLASSLAGLIWYQFERMSLLWPHLLVF
jgi:hypothetical protein